MNISKRLINHIIFAVDASESMRSHRTTVPKVFDGLLARLKQTSINLNQETRVSIYYFNSHVNCEVFDTDVMRVQSIAGTYNTTGMTALADAVTLAISDHQRLPQIYSDHSFLLYVITDGEENHSSAANLQGLRGTLKIQDATENWTVAVMVPDSTSKYRSKNLGFQEGNVDIWNTSETNAVEKIGDRAFNVLSNYMNMRSAGVRKTSNLFEVNAANLTKKSIEKALPKVRAGQFITLPVNSTEAIQPFVTRHMGSYKIGSAYYQLTKTEKVQASKDIIIRRRATGELFADARAVLGLPDGDIKVTPGNFGEWDIFVRSTSVNRKLLPSTDLLVKK